MRCDLIENDDEVTLRIHPDRGFWTAIVLPLVILVLVLADYTIDGQGRMAQLIGKYVVPAGLTLLLLLTLFRTKVIGVTGQVFVLENRIFGLQWAKRAPLHDVEYVEFVDFTAESSSSLQVNWKGHAWLSSCAAGVDTSDAARFFGALRQRKGIATRIR